MSVSSCPRCAQQVTLPVGVSNSARVRCPLCNAHYTLADALVNMPPLLEVLDNGQADGGLDWLDEATESDSTAPPTAIGVADEPDLNLDDALGLGDEPELSAAVESEEELRFDAVEMEHDDSDTQDQDTEVEELPFTTSAALVRHAPEDDEPVEVSAADDADFLDFGSAVAKNEPSALGDELGSLDEEVSLEEEISFDFQEEGAATTPGDDEVSFDFEEVADAAESRPKIDELGLPVRAVAADEDPIELDFADADADPAATISFTEEPETKGKKKKAKAAKAVKVKAPKAPKEPGERSLVGTLLSLVLAGLIAIPLALYGALWISSDYDFIGMRKWLPSAMLPAGKPSRTLAQAPPALPPSTPPDTSTETPAEPTVADPAAAGQPSTKDAAATPQPPAEPGPATDAPALSEPPDPTPTEPAPAEPVPAEPLPIEPPAADTTTATPPAEAPGAEPAEASAPAEEMPAEPKADEPAEPIADPFAEPSESTTPATEEPQEDASEPKEEMPAESDTVAPATDEPADPFAESAPADAAPADAPAADEAAAAPAEPEEPLGPRNAQKFSPDDIVKAAQDFGAADQRMAAALASMDKNDVKKARANFFLSLYHFADVLAAVNREPFDKQPPDFQQGMRQLARDKDRLKELGAFAAKWLGFGKRTTPGIVLAGTVESAEQVGKLHHITVKLTDDAPSVEIVSHNDPGVAAGDQVIVLGTIVQQPDEHLAGYEGTAPVVVWSGVTFNTQAGEK